LQGYKLTILIIFCLSALTALCFLCSYLPKEKENTNSSAKAEDPILLENEAHALEFLRGLPSLQGEYAGWYSDQGNPGTFQHLKQASEGEETPLLPQDFAFKGRYDYVIKKGYCFQIFLSPDNAKFCAYAWPESLGSTGNDSFFLYQDVVFRLTGIYSGSDNIPHLEAAFQGKPFKNAPEIECNTFNDKQLWEYVPGTD